MASVQELLSLLLDSQSAKALNSCIVTADRGHGREIFM